MKEHREDIIKIAVSAVCLAVLMIITGIFRLPLFAKILLYAVPYLIIGGEVLKEAAENIVHGKVFNECFLMSIATLGAFFVGEYPEAVFVMLFFAVGELFEHIASERSRKSISQLMDIRPETANIETDDGIKTVPPESVKKGDIIIVKPGEKVPLDGIVEDGRSSLNTSALTGESMPTDVEQGDKVISGCVNLSGLLRISVTNEYGESTASKILDLVENASEKKAKTENFITRFAHWYTPAVVIFAFLFAVVPTVFFGDFTKWLYRALTFLVVSCPCALVVSVPLTFFGGIGGASKKGILIKGSEDLENISKIGTVVFDKTGTLTAGKFFVTAVHPNKISEERLLEIAAAAESFSDHPISKSLKEAYNGDIGSVAVENVSEIAGFGVSATVGSQKVLVGNDKLMRKMNIDYRDCHRTGTVVHIAADGEYAGHIVISDRTKPDSISAIKELKLSGIKTVMLTGDREETARAVAEETGMDKYFSSLLPQDKVSCLEKIIDNNPSDKKVGFVGDGINDAPVLARADIGIAMGALGSDAAIEAADIVLMDDRVSKIPTAVSLSRKTVGIVRQNIAFSLLVKFAVLTLSAAGLANMWAASFADVGVLVICVLNAMRTLNINKKTSH